MPHSQNEPRRFESSEQDNRPTPCERPGDCRCSPFDVETGLRLPCWPCYRDGFEKPNPDPEGDDDD